MDVIDAAGPRSLIDEAAQIWAEATAAPDGHARARPECLPVKASSPLSVIQTALAGVRRRDERRDFDGL